MVQRGTNHAWANRSGKNARVAFVLVDAQAARHRQAGAGHDQRALTGGDHACTSDHASRSPAACSGASPSRGAARAQSYPNGQVRLIVPTSPGGVTDTMARIVAQRLTENAQGQTVIVDNRAGRQRLGRRHRGGARAARRADAAGHLGRHHHRQPVAVEQARLQRQGVHADHRAVPRHADAGGQLQGAGQERARS